LGTGPALWQTLLQLFSRGEFARAVKKHSAERNIKGLTCWGQFVAMLFCQVAQLKSLREIGMGLASREAPPKSETPKKSTLAYANENRPWELYQTIFGQVLEKCEAEVAARGGRKKSRFKNRLMSLDGSIIDLSERRPLLFTLDRRARLDHDDTALCHVMKGSITFEIVSDHHAVPHTGVFVDNRPVDSGPTSDVAIVKND
jgi:hypothetical protein